jgi:hypothetical protein
MIVEVKDRTTKDIYHLWIEKACASLPRFDDDANSPMASELR